MADLRVPDLNVVYIAGRLTRDPDLKYTSGSNRAYCRFGIANTRYYKTKEGDRREETTFVNGSCWDRQAEWVGERLKKGRPVLVEGTLRSYESEDRDSGQKTTRLEINARRVTPLDWDEDMRGGGPTRTESPGYRQEPSPGRQESRPMPRPIEEPIPEDDIPF